RADARVQRGDRAWPSRPRQGEGDRRRPASRAGNADLRGRRRSGQHVIGQTNGVPISITGLGCHVPERVLTNDELSTLVDTNDEWIIERTGIRERRIARDDEALTDIALPACRRALEMAGVAAKDIDLVIVATVTPDMSFPSAGALIAGEPRTAGAAAPDPTAR